MSHNDSNLSEHMDVRNNSLPPWRANICENLKSYLFPWIISEWDKGDDLLLDDRSVERIVSMVMPPNQALELHELLTMFWLPSLRLELQKFGDIPYLNDNDLCTLVSTLRRYLLLLI